ncbi:MAG: ABC transporter substrate-binding protein [Terriglobia bacterium]
MTRVRVPGSLIVVVMLIGATAPRAQQNPGDSAPYAAINRSAIDYSGPDREASRDLAETEIKIGILAPLQGLRKAEGDALVAAAQMAVEDESAAPLAAGRRLGLAVRDESGLWGRASSDLVKLVVDDRAIALITSPDGRAAHLAEQVGNRLGVPVLSLATDSQNTRINIPWYFRMVPDDAVQARLFAEDIYRTRRLGRVLLITEDDHDGRVGREEFEKAARRLNAPAPVAVGIPALDVSAESVTPHIKATQPPAIVIWASADTAARVLATLPESSAEIYVCHKGLREPFLSAARKADGIRVWTASAGTRTDSRDQFDLRFQSRFGSPITPAAREMYDAVRLIAAGLRESGPNRARLRDALAARGEFRGVSGVIAFDGAGNNQAESALIPLR